MRGLATSQHVANNQHQGIINVKVGAGNT